MPSTQAPPFAPRRFDPHRRLRSACLLLALAATGHAAPPAEPGLGVKAAPGGTRITYGAGPKTAVLLRESISPVEAARTVTLDQAGVVVAAWRETAGDAPGDYVAVSRDRGAHFDRARRVSYRIALKAGSIEPGSAAPVLPAALESRPEGRLFVVQLEAAGVGALRDQVVAKGARILATLPGESHLVSIEPGKAADLRALPFVRWVGPFHPGYRLERPLLDELAAGAVPPGTRRYRVLGFEPREEGKPRLAADIEARGGKVVLNLPLGYLLEAELTAAALASLVHSDHLQWIQLWTPDEEDMDVVREVSGAVYLEGVAGYTGQGVRAEVMDGGLNELHQDFDGVLLHRDVDIGTATGMYHGTCTYGTTFGNGDRDGDGAARALSHLPSAQGYFADYGYLNRASRHQYTLELVSAPIFASFQSNSWGGSRTLSYDAVSAEMDDLLWMYDIPILQSQSNAGTRMSRPQAWSKNVVSVGGVYHRDTADKGDDCWCGGASIGPSEDGSIKPDISHFYDQVYTTDADPNGYAGGPYYSAFNGTSVATPISAGITGLVLQMWADNVLGNNPEGTTVFEKRPHMSTTKALLINTADQYPFTGTNHDLTRVHQGWGLPSARNLYDRASVIKVIDESSVLQEGDVDVYRANVAPFQTELKITLVYTDLPASPPAAVLRVNDVSLRVIAPDATEYWGNVGLDRGNYSIPGGQADTLNTVENVFIQNPQAGQWRIEVSADALNQDQHLETPGVVDQDYALVVNGVSDLIEPCAGSVPPTGVSASASGANAIEVRWTSSAPSHEVWRSTGGCAGPFTLVATVVGPATSYTDTPVSGGVDYGYALVSRDARCASVQSACTVARTTGSCTAEPAFEGVLEIHGASVGACGISLDWRAAASVCGGPVVYNVYRSTSATFTPDATNRVARCVGGTSYFDRAGLSPGQTYYYVVRAEDRAGTGSGPCGGLEEANTERLSLVPARLLHHEDFENGLGGWTASLGVPPATAGGFVVGDPVGSGAQPEDDVNPLGTRCLYTGENPGAMADTDDVDGGEVRAESPVFDASGVTTARLSYWRFHHNRSRSASGVDTGDYFRVEVSNDGGASWTRVENLDETTSEPTWTLKSFDLQALLPLTANMKLRFSSADGTRFENIIESAIDEVSVVTEACTQVLAVPGVVEGSPAPLTLVKQGSDVRFAWGSDCGGTTRYGLYQGDLGLKYPSLAPLPATCDLATQTLDIPNGPGREFYLVAPNDGSFEGSLGWSSAGRRPQPASACYPRANPWDSCAP